MQNVVYLGRDNPVVIEFTWSGEFAAEGLNNFDDIALSLGGESYSSVSNPENVTIDSQTQLSLIIGVDTALSVGRYELSVVGFNGIYDDGYELNQCDALKKVVVK